MEKIIDPVSKELLKAELTPDKKLRDTNKGGNEIYVVTWHDSPNVVTEIGRLREEAFRQAGGSFIHFSFLVKIMFLPVDIAQKA